jgi:hypothetical protein
MPYCLFKRLLSFYPVPAFIERGVTLGDGKSQVQSAQPMKKQVFRGRVICGELPGVLEIWSQQSRVSQP